MDSLRDLVRHLERAEFYNLVAWELCRAGTITGARSSLTMYVEQDASGTWRLIGNDWTAVAANTFYWRRHDTQEEIVAYRNRGLAGCTTDSDRGVPYKTIQHWIDRELRPRQLLAPAGLRGRARRGESKFLPGPALRDPFG